VHVLAVEHGHDVRVLFDLAGVAQVGQGGLLVRASSLARLSWARAITGTFSSLASAFSPREMLPTSCARLSPVPRIRPR
jgi:hypothetical protein